MYIVFMAGGVGTRFWPMSRRDTPKQLLPIVGEASMLLQTYDRIRGMTPEEKILVITGEHLVEAVQKDLPDIPKENIIAEPIGRNTAPCVGLAGAIMQSRGHDGDVMVVLPADHLISDVENFRETIRIGMKFAQNNDVLLTMGIKPTYPETGYGYIQVGREIFRRDEKVIYQVKTFAEKPILETAEKFLKSGDFLWNSGMFIWRADLIMREIDEYLPELGADLCKIRDAVGGKSFAGVVQDVYSRTKSISVDYGIMENSRNVAVIGADFSWNDVGSWEAVYNISDKDANENVFRAKEQVVIDSRNNYINSEGKIVALVGVENMIVVEMDDALLICSKDRSQDVKTVVELLMRREKGEYL